MSTKQASHATKSNFGSKGWLMIVIAGLMFYFYSGMCTDGLNTIVSNFAFVILAFSLERTGAYNLSYWIIAGLDVVAIVLISLIRDECVGKK